MVNKIWAFFLLSGILFCVFTGQVEVVNEEILNSTKTSLDMAFRIFPVMALWLGIMRIATDSGFIQKVTKWISPLLLKIFPEIPAGHESLGFIASNIVANMMGLGNAATPFGLKAMSSLQEINPNKKVASKSMITFLVLNTSGLTIIPTTIISLRMMYGSQNPTSIVLLCLLATVCSTFAGLFMDRLLRRKYD